MPHLGIMAQDALRKELPVLFLPQVQGAQPKGMSLSWEDGELDQSARSSVKKEFICAEAISPCPGSTSQAASTIPPLQLPTEKETPAT